MYFLPLVASFPVKNTLNSLNSVIYAITANRLSTSLTLFESNSISSPQQRRFVVDLRFYCKRDARQTPYEGCDCPQKVRLWWNPFCKGCQYIDIFFPVLCFSITFNVKMFFFFLTMVKPWFVSHQIKSHNRREDCNDDVEMCVGSWKRGL